MRTVHDLSQLQWRLSGWTPHAWRFSKSMETGATSQAEIQPVPARVPGSAQSALREAGVLPDWNAGLNARLCEWVENRHWIFETVIPNEWLLSAKSQEPNAKSVRLRCLGLDYCGCVLLNGKELAQFQGSFVPREFDLTPHLMPKDNRLALVFECPPRWLGQFGYTSRMTEWKPRFNYTWDWVSRLVQIGAWDDISLEVTNGNAFQTEPHGRDIRCSADANPAAHDGTLSVFWRAASGTDTRVRVTLEDGARVVHTEEIGAVKEWAFGSLTWRNLPVELWWPNGAGAQPLYTLRCQLLDGAGKVLDEDTRRVGFKHLEWQTCAGAPPGADPWLCVVNDKPVFLQGVNWTPIRPNFADVTADEYRQRLELYRDLGFNLLRVWGGAFLEKQCFYDLCDELGLMVWQEFPLSSSGVDNWPPEDEASVSQLADIARSYMHRRQHHVALAVWCGGNELQGSLDGNKEGIGRPVDATHPLIKALRETVARHDPGRRFLATSASGPRFTADERDFGKGLHWDVHGPWRAEGALDKDWTRYWQNDDALFRSETGSPGASPVDIIRQYIGECRETPGTLANPLWRRTAWWIEWPEFVREKGREPRDLEEYVAWSQARQAEALSIAVRACKRRFPHCGGVIIWMGHDAFPCAANTAIVDFRGRAKPAALALGAVFRAQG